MTQFDRDCDILVVVDRLRAADPGIYAASLRLAFIACVPDDYFFLPGQSAAAFAAELALLDNALVNLQMNPNANYPDNGQPPPLNGASLYARVRAVIADTPRRQAVGLPSVRPTE